ncbi:MAG: polysaccharide deacetylase family protein [Phycisphaerae bacterium]|nr:polysaccharide deacetylase family protein [Phycisphaerae bacterium]
MTLISFNSTFEQWPGKFMRSLRRRQNDMCTTILTYHSISREESIFTTGPGMRHLPSDFERELDYLAEHYNVISLRELTGQLERGEEPRRAIVITFDDGFADSVRQALPILYRRRMPMTIFPVTSVIGNRDLMWQHKLAWLSVNGHEDRVWTALSARGWPPTNSRETLHDYVRLYFRNDLCDALECVLKDVGTSGSELARHFRPYLTEQEIAESDPEYVEFGNHTDTHPVLSALTAQQQMAEIGAARRKLTELTGRQPFAFAYPFGLKRHYNDTTRSLAIDLGHRAIVDMRRRLNVGLVNPHDLSRRPGPCGSQAEFERMIESRPANAASLPVEESKDVAR